MLGDHGIYLKGPHFYEPAVRVPLIIACPEAVEGGRRSAALVELFDLAPTVLDACGRPRHPGMQARSLWPMLVDPDRQDPGREDVYSEYYQGMAVYESTAYATMVRTEAAKIVVAHGCNAGELYDLEADPTETHNRWDDPAYAELRLDMMSRLADRMAWTVDPLPEREAGFQPDPVRERSRSRIVLEERLTQGRSAVLRGPHPHPRPGA